MTASGYVDSGQMIKTELVIVVSFYIVKVPKLTLPTTAQATGQVRFHLELSAGRVRKHALRVWICKLVLYVVLKQIDNSL